MGTNSRAGDTNMVPAYVRHHPSKYSHPAQPEAPLSAEIEDTSQLVIRAREEGQFTARDL